MITTAAAIKQQICPVTQVNSPFRARLRAGAFFRITAGKWPYRDTIHIISLSRIFSFANDDDPLDRIENESTPTPF
jgi:hypothetical protein